MCRVWPKNEEERASLAQQGFDDEACKKVYMCEDLAHGEGIVFAATGITDNALLRGVKVNGNVAMTHSVVMRARSRTVRYVKAYHDLTRKTIRLHTGEAHRLI